MTTNTFLRAVALAGLLVGAIEASAQTATLQGRRLYLYDGGVAPNLQRVGLSAPDADSLTNTYNLTLPRNNGVANDIPYIEYLQGAGAGQRAQLSFTDGGNLFWKVTGNAHAITDGTNNLFGTLAGTDERVRMVTNGNLNLVLGNSSDEYNISVGGNLPDANRKLQVDWTTANGPAIGIGSNLTYTGGGVANAVGIFGVANGNGDNTYGIRGEAIYDGAASGLTTKVVGIYGSANSNGTDILSLGAELFAQESDGGAGYNVGSLNYARNAFINIGTGAAGGASDADLGNLLSSLGGSNYGLVAYTPTGASGNIGAYIESGYDGVQIQSANLGLLIGVNSAPIIGAIVEGNATGILVGDNSTPLVGVNVNAQAVAFQAENAVISFDGDGNTFLGDDNADVHTIQGQLLVNSTAGQTATTTIGQTTDGGAINFATAGDLTVDVLGAGSDVVVNGLDLDANPTTWVTITAGNELRESDISSLVEQGITFNNEGGTSRIRLGGLAATDNPFLDNRYVNLDANSLTFTSNAGSSNTLTIIGGANSGATIETAGTGIITLTGETVINTVTPQTTTIGVATGNNSIFGALNVNFNGSDNTAINTGTATGFVEIGNTTSGGAISLLANTNITIDVAATTNNLVLNNILNATIDNDLLWITAGNEVRRATATSTADEGIIFETGAYRLGTTATGNGAGTNPFLTNRNVNLDNFFLTFNRGAGTDAVLTIDGNNDALIGDAENVTMLGNTAVNINNTGVGATVIGSAAAGAVSLESASTITATAATTLDLNGTDIDADATATIDLSAGTTLAATGGTGATITATTNDLTLAATAGNIVLNSGTNVDVNATGDVTVDGVNITETATTTYTLEAPTANLNAAGTGATTIGNTGALTLNATNTNDLTVNVTDGSSDLVLNGLTDVAPGANDDILWITDAGNEVRRTSFDGLSDEGIQYENSAFRLGSSAIDVNPVVSTRIVTVGGGGTLSFWTTGAGFNMLQLNDNGNVAISSAGSGLTSIGSVNSGAVTLLSSTNVDIDAPTVNVNATAGNNTVVGNATGNFSLVSTALNVTTGGLISDAANNVQVDDNLEILSAGPGARSLVFRDETGDNTTSFTAGEQAADISYVLPLTLTPTNTIEDGVLQTDATGNLSWLDINNLINANEGLEYNAPYVQLGSITDGINPITVARFVRLDATGSLEINSSTTDFLNADGATGNLELNNGGTGTTNIGSITGGTVSVSAGGAGSSISLTANNIIELDATTIDADATGAVTIDGGSTVDVTGATGASVVATTNNLTLNATAGQVDLNAGTTLNAIGATGALVRATTNDLALEATAGQVNANAGTTFNAIGATGALVRATTNDLALEATAGQVNATAGTTFSATGATGATLTATTNAVDVVALAGNVNITATGAGNDVVVNAPDDVRFNVNQVIINTAGTPNLQITETNINRNGNLSVTVGANQLQLGGAAGTLLLNGVSGTPNITATSLASNGGAAFNQATDGIVIADGTGLLRRRPVTEIVAANQGLVYNETTTDAEVRLGSTTDGTNAITTSRFVRIGGGGTLEFNSSATNTLLQLTNTGDVNLNTEATGTGTVTIGNNGNTATVAASTINVGVNAYATTINVGTENTQNKTINIGSAGAAGAPVINVSAAGDAVNINTTGTGTTTIGSVANGGNVFIAAASGSTVALQATSGVNINTAGTGVTNINNAASTGNVAIGHNSNTTTVAGSTVTLNGNTEAGNTTIGNTTAGGTVTLQSNTVVVANANTGVNIQTSGNGDVTIGNSPAQNDLLVNSNLRGAQAHVNTVTNDQFAGTATYTNNTGATVFAVSIANARVSANSAIIATLYDQGDATAGQSAFEITNQGAGTFTVTLTGGIPDLSSIRIHYIVINQ